MHKNKSIKEKTKKEKIKNKKIFYYLPVSTIIILVSHNILYYSNYY